MMCPGCASTGKKHGKDRNGQQRYKCRECGQTYLDPRPMAGSRTPLKQVAFALNLLLEGTSSRAIERLTGINYESVLQWLVKAGRACQDFLPYSVYCVQVQDVEVDEVWGFVFCKERTAFNTGRDESVGDAYTFVGIERNTKLILAFHVGKRDHDSTEAFAEKLRIATSGRFQLTTDGFAPYSVVMPDAFADRLDFARLIKTYKNPKEAERRRYSPPMIVETERQIVCGNPVQKRICTSIIERSNLSARMHNRRMTRLTNAHSKKWENHECMTALYYCWYNWCRVHSTLKTTPAVAAGLATETWTLQRLLTEAAKVERMFATLH